MPVLPRRRGEKKSAQYVRSARHEQKRGKLHSGSKHGPLVTNPRQAVAIGLSQARRAGAKVPARRGIKGAARKAKRSSGRGRRRG